MPNFMHSRFSFALRHPKLEHFDEVIGLGPLYAALSSEEKYRVTHNAQTLIN